MATQKIEDIFKVLKQENCNPEYVNKDKCGFSRTIKFKTPYQTCWIEWWVNQCYLFIGDKYGNKLPFMSMQVNTTWPSFERGFSFHIDIQSFYLVLEKLEWQEEKELK